MAAFDDELAAIHAAFAEPVRYTGAGLSNQPIAAVESEMEAAAFTGPGSTLRETHFEIRFASLPAEPCKGDLIVQPAGNAWEVIDVTRRRDVGAWLLLVAVTDAPPPPIGAAGQFDFSDPAMSGLLILLIGDI